MSDLLKPLYTLSIGEFVELTRKTVQNVVSENQPETSAAEKEEHFNIPQCAKFLQCTVVSIHNYKKKGLPYYRIGRKILFKKSEVLEFMKKKFNKRIV